MSGKIRMYPGVRGPRPDKVVARRDLETERLEWWRSLTSAKQLAELDRRLGRGVGAKRQRARLQATLKMSKTRGSTPNKGGQTVPGERSQKAKDRRKAERKKKG